MVTKKKKTPARKTKKSPARRTSPRRKDPSDTLGSRAQPSPDRKAAVDGRRKYHRFYKDATGTVKELPATQWGKNKASGPKRPLNPYFKAMLAAKKKDVASFQYKGSTYKRTVLATGLVTYKKARK